MCCETSTDQGCYGRCVRVRPEASLHKSLKSALHSEAEVSGTRSVTRGPGNQLHTKMDDGNSQLTPQSHVCLIRTSQVKQRMNLTASGASIMHHLAPRSRYGGNFEAPIIYICRKQPWTMISRSRVLCAHHKERFRKTAQKTIRNRTLIAAFSEHVDTEYRECRPCLSMRTSSIEYAIVL